MVHPLLAEGDKVGATPAGACLYRSRDELLDLDFCVDLRQSPSGKQRKTLTSLNKGFSLHEDDDHQQAYTPRPPPQEPAGAAAASLSNNSEHRVRWWNRRPNIPRKPVNEICNSSSDGASSSSWHSKWPSWSARNPLCNPLRVIKMAFKRHYLLLMCLSLVIASCLLATLVISRRVGDLDDEQTDSERRGSAGFSMGLTSLLPVQMETRTIDLVDLTESGKTFAFTRYKVRLEVPKSSPTYKQRPNFVAKLPDSQRTGTDLQRAGSAPSKLILTSTQGAPAGATKVTSASSNSSKPADDALSLSIRPVSSGDEPAKRQAEPAIGELATLLAVSTDNQARVAEDELEQQLEIGQLLAEASEPDPVEYAASSMQAKGGGQNRTLVDCFIVDTDKRYGQRVLFEDTYRMVASTRRVSFKKMLNTIVECRKLTWASLAHLANKGSVSTRRLIADSGQARAEESAPVIDLVRRPEEQPAAGQQAHDLIGSLFTDWLRPSTGAQEAQESRRVDQASRPVEEPKKSGQQRRQQQQPSYFNNALSMFNGIVPNTLWCGLGDRAANYSELGAEFMVDSCCRAHDHCPIRLKPWTAGYGLTNWSMSTRSHCDCDDDFSNCLNAVNSTLSYVIRELYSRLVGVQCIKVENRRAYAPVPV